MFSINCFRVFLFYFLFFNNVLGEQPYGPHPRIVSDNGNLIIYAADHKNVTLKTTSNGYINLNDENLVLIVKNARNAAETVQRIQTNVINPFSTSMNRINDIIDGPDGLLKRISYLEGRNNTQRIPTQYPSILRPNRPRQIAVILRRVRALEIKMASMYNLLVMNECTSNPCKNGGECRDLYNGYLCHCTDAWTGPTCETDVNECSKFAGTDLGCQNGATCVNKQGSYECTCAVGWFGIHCNRRSQDCNSGSPQELCGHGICVSQNTGIGYKCICDQGWKTDGNSPACTVDVNECESVKPHCSVNPLVPCINVPGTFYCGNCPQGYSGNGYYCSDIDECLTFNGGCSMNPRVQCINTMGSRICGTCPPGYIGDGVTCSYRGVCQINNGGCHQLAQCVDNPNISDNYVQCICPNGYVGNGMGPMGCTRTDISPYISACSSNPCVHGTCMSHSNSSFTCLCQNGYSGTTCNIKQTTCDSNPCLNGGTCSNTGSGYACECTSNFTGTNCDTEREVCGGYISNQKGFLQYPANNNSNYNHKVSCSWVIQTLPDKVLNITFTKFHLEESATCQYDWLQMHDGPNSGSHLIGRFCGTELPKGGVITSTLNKVYIWFRSDKTVSHLGFALKWDTIDPACGGVISVESHGTIQSPGFPGNYPPNRDCLWNLVSPYGKRIQLHFFSLKIGYNANCTNDYLEIRSSSTVLNKFCNTSNPEPIISTGSSLNIYFHSNEIGTDKGFQIAYSLIEGIPGCGGTFTRSRGEITSPVHDELYPSNLDCEYKIKMDKNFRIKIVFLSFALELSSTCRFDFLEIREGGKIDSPLVGKYCGSNIPPSHSSLGNELYIRFKTDAFINDGGFRIKYESLCGNVYDTPTGKIESYPSETPKTCTYEIKQEPQKAIKLKFKNIADAFRFSDCAFSYIEVRDGDSQNSPLIGKYCGHEIPSQIISTHNFMWIHFESRVTIIKEFEAEYSTIDLQCGGILKESHGVVRSPQSPNKYPPNTKCTWLLNAPPGHSIQINWINFNLEFAMNCNAVDYVSLYENNTDTGNSSLMGQYCGKKLPPIMTSTTNVVTIIFKSDNSLNADGFSLIYSFLDDTKTCGGNFFVPAGVIKSPNYPQYYFPNKDCVWVITVPHGQQIMLNIEDFELEQYLSCRSDYLEIRNGAFENSPLIGSFCGKNIPKQIPSHTNNIYLKFHSDNAVNKKGFKIYWDGTSTGCGGILTSPTGQISSPNYPQTYGANAMCFWKISTSAGSALDITFLDLQLEEHMLCRLDYVEIFDGLDVQSKSFGRFCSDANSHAVRTSTNRALVKFRSDITLEQRGFLLKYTTLCNITLTGYRGVIESLNFPNLYPKNQDCTWTIKVPVGNKINISFSHFDLENVMNLKPCKFDYLEIVEMDDYGSSQSILDRSCGNELPPPIHTTKSRAKVHFISDALVHATGFRLEWVVDGCSQLLTHPTGKISTPGYPYEYAIELECHWQIQVEFNSSIMLNITDFGFEESSDCTYDSLQVFNGPDENAPLLTKICHNSKDNLIFVSTSNVMFLKFSSDSSNGGKGFAASYKTVPNQCGGKYTAPRGSIHSRNYPKNYRAKDDCEWLIEVHDSYRVELTLEDLDIISSVNCTTNYLKIYDGNSSEAPLLYNLCGNNKPNSTIRASTNALYLRMSSSGSRTSKGFLANYTTSCGMRKIVSTNGLLDIADWGCTWTLIADSPEKHISLTITHLQLSKDCESPTLKIYDGLSEEAPVIGSYCGTKAPPMLVTKGSAMHIVLSYAYVGYISATYSVLSSECGGTYTSLEGYFSSVGYPDNYPMNTECQWTVSLAPGNKVQLSFQTFDLVASDNCNADYVEIREKNSHGKLIGIYCGNEIPSNITKSESLWIQFKSSDIGTAKGFLAEYKLVHGNELFGPSGQIASPLYPKYYEDQSFWSDSFISWRITVEFQSVILITFKDFYINLFMGSDCFASGVEIYDGYDDTAPLLASICSIRIPDSIRTTSNVAYVKFYISTLRYHTKFLLEWKQIRPTRINKNLLGNITDCGSSDIIDIYSIKNYTLKSPGFPTGYAGRLNCEWIFSTIPGNHLSIGFNTLDLEASSSTCMLDSVKIYTGLNGNANFRLVKNACLSNITSEPKIHTSNLMKVVFHTDAYINKTGFEANIWEECGGNFNGPMGVIELKNSTGYKRIYFKMKCVWNITVKAGRTIEIRFLEFQMNNNDDCHNYIMFKNGIYPDSPLLGNGKYCGPEIPNINTTTGNTLHISLYSIGSATKFKLMYKEVSLSCGGHITLDNSYKSENISSPNYPNIPPPHTECTWIITGPPGESLQIDFVDRFDLTYSKDCKKAGVELRDGGTIVSNLIGVYCSDTPSTIKSTDNILYVRFFTDVNDPRNGFSATISIATCGGVYRGKSGKLTSPNYPAISTYPANTICTWQIVGPLDHYLTLSFNDFRFPFMRNCSKTNHLIVKEKLIMGNETILGTFCGTRTNIPDLRTSSNIVTIQMKIIAPQRGFKGFSLTYNTSQEACGGELDAESGIITSPGYPLSQHYNRNCEWYITAPVGRRITAYVLDFDLDYTQYYYNQGLAFFNAKNYRSHILYMHGNDKANIIRSSSNHMMVYFWSLSSSSHRGFKLRYESNEPSICTGDFTKDSGVITTPTANLTTYYCQWDRRSDDLTTTNKSLSLVINAPSIGRSTSYNCKHVTSSIYVTTENENEYIAQLCGTYTEPQVIRTPFLNAKLMVTQGKYHDIMNYTITYKVNPCGGILSTSSGFLASPNFPNRYSDAVDCAWVIKTEEGQAISLNFTTIDLDPNCARDYIDIYNGPLPTSPKIGRYCGKNNPGRIVSQNNALWIDYHGSKDGKGKGFTMNYEPLTSGCGGVFYDRNRVIASPNYPNSYPNDAECTWEVHTDEGYHIGLSFIGRFHLEDSPNCTNDFIEVFDYVDEEWLSIGRNCGRNQTNYFNSTTNRMRILFRSNSKLTASGFQAVWSLNCGGNYLATTTPKYLMSPGYPKEYKELLNCKYIINAPGKYVNIVFEDFKLETGGAACSYDNVTISKNRFPSPWFHLRYRSLSYTTLGVFCGTTIPPPVRRQNMLILTFRTDKYVNRKGFQLRYFVDSCGGALNEEGEITSPKDITGKDAYYGSMRCVWNITAPTNKVVILRFTFIEFEHHRNCQYDSISIYNGKRVDNSQRLALLCGNITTNLPIIRSSENNLLLVMKTDASNNLRGFKANFVFMYDEKVGCGGTVNLTGETSPKILKSPEIDNSGNYLDNLDCQWLIVAAPDESIEMTFETFHMNECANATEEQKCTCDYLQIRDGGGPLAELTAQLCGHNLPAKVISSRNQLWIRMFTDGYGSSTGFRVRIKRMTSICGPSILTVTDKKQYLTSPNYPNNYPHNTRCSWTLIASQLFTKMEIHFDDLDIQDTTVEGACSTDKLQIADKLLSHIITEGLGQNFVFTGARNIPTHLGVQLPSTTFTYCGTNKPPSFYSLRNEVTVTFTSDHTISKKGFKLDYRVTGCNHNYTGVQGRVLNDINSANCVFKITAPENYTISIYFQQFFFNSYFNTNCEPYNLQVYDGLISNSTRLGKLCGFQLPSPIFSNTNELWFKVINNRRGVYDFIYTTTNQGKGCGGQLFNFMGKFTSPQYPSIYRKNSDCRWDISVPIGLQVSLKFLIFDLGTISSTDSCTSNFVELIDIDPISKAETIHSTYCAGNTPAIFQSSGNIMALRYKTNLNNAGSGWVAVFSSKVQATT